MHIMYVYEYYHKNIISYVIRDMGVIQNADTHSWETRGQTPNHV